MEFQTTILVRKPRTKNAKLKDGSTREYKIKGGYYFRIRYTEPSGRPRVVERGPYKLKNHAKDAMSAQVRELQSKGGRGQDQMNLTFNEFADYCFNEGMYSEGSVKSRDSIKAYLKSLRSYFGNFRLRNITRESIRDYQAQRAKQYRPTKGGDPPRHISAATINRELSTLRAMLFFAIGEGWIAQNPFFKLRVISTKSEIARTRVLSIEEEQRLLSACEGKWTREYQRTRNGKIETLTANFELNNRHLRAIIMTAVDSALRLSEILKLQWRDIDFDNHKITVRRENTKTGQRRDTVLSSRVKAILLDLKAQSNSDRPFPYSDIKRSFGTAKRLAGIEDLRFHDLRRTAISRWQASGVPLAFAGKSAGHSQLQTTHKHYTVIDDDQIDAIRKGVDRYNSPDFELQSIN